MGIKRVCVIVNELVKGRNDDLGFKLTLRRSPVVPSFEDMMMAMLGTQFNRSGNLVGAVNVDEGEGSSGM